MWNLPGLRMELRSPHIGRQILIHQGSPVLCYLNQAHLEGEPAVPQSSWRGAGRVVLLWFAEGCFSYAWTVMMWSWLLFYFLVITDNTIWYWHAVRLLTARGEPCGQAWVRTQEFQGLGVRSRLVIAYPRLFFSFLSPYPLDKMKSDHRILIHHV